MSTADNKALVQRYIDEVWNKRALALADDLVSPSYDPGLGIPARGADGARILVQVFLGAFPDFALKTEDVFGEDDRVALRFTFTGTQRGPWGGVPATGKAVRIEGTTIYRIDAGKVAATWFSYDGVGLLQQIGALPG
ncbi:MAG TPA: ester cyclase [Kofleriaceae bacterium]|jgi:steroid delta-isomerase-like uncharacterized protein|nr:ester cyclase [Kofleriaceae bacterium]